MSVDNYVHAKLPNILEEANDITANARKAEYGPAKENFGRTAKVWSEILGIQVTPLQVTLCMIALKLMREVQGHKRDSLVDIAGYARTAEMVMEPDS